MSPKRQAPKGGFRPWLPGHARRRQAEAIERLCEILERIEAESASPIRGGSGGAPDTAPREGPPPTT